VTSFDEVVAVLFIAGPDQQTIPRQMWNGIREQISPAILRRGHDPRAHNSVDVSGSRQHRACLAVRWSCCGGGRNGID
jgi:hypothetical protein